MKEFKDIKMDEDVTKEKPRLGEDNTRGPVRNVSTAPASRAPGLSGLESVQEEDEQPNSSASKAAPPGGEVDRGEEADTEAAADTEERETTSKPRQTPTPHSPSRANSSCNRRHQPSNKVTQLFFCFHDFKVELTINTLTILFYFAIGYSYFLSMQALTQATSFVSS